MEQLNPVGGRTKAIVSDLVDAFNSLLQLEHLDNLERQAADFQARVERTRAEADQAVIEQADRVAAARAEADGQIASIHADLDRLRASQAQVGSELAELAGQRDATLEALREAEAKLADTREQLQRLALRIGV